MKKNIVIFGASSTISQNIIDLYKEEKANVYAFSRSKLKAKGINSFQTNYNEKSLQKMKALFKDIEIDIVFFANGFLSNEVEDVDNIFLINSIIPIKLTDMILSLKPQKCKFVFFNSPSSERGRKFTFLYGAAKKSIDIFCQGMRHKHSQTNKDIEFYNIIIHPTLTKMTNHLSTKDVFADPNSVAKKIIKVLSKKNYHSYLSFKWLLIMFIIKKLPSFIFNKLNI
jgi:decaprenylphospho-beta-D-erythro-pentofuranosid-2-ulose 2-reductase